MFFKYCNLGSLVFMILTNLYKIKTIKYIILKEQCILVFRINFIIIFQHNIKKKKKNIFVSKSY